MAKKTASQTAPESISEEFLSRLQAEDNPQERAKLIWEFYKWGGATEEQFYLLRKDFGVEEWNETGAHPAQK